jgi:threonine dehydrogenase-like Zn-dependent dehydrogenase
LGVQRDGALTEYISIHPQKIYPAGLGLEELCLVEPLTIGFHAVARGRVQPKDCVAVIGCGGVGLGAIAASAARDAKTIAIDLDDEKLKIAMAAGATNAINSSREPLHDQLAELTSGRGPDVIIEAIGLPQTFRVAVEEVAYAGRVVYIGYAKEPVEYETALFVKKELDILGSRNALDADFNSAIRMLEEFHFPVGDAISHIIRLEQVPKALRSWSESPTSVRKIMVSLD